MSVMVDRAERIALSPAELLAAVGEWERQGALLAVAARHVEAVGSFGADGAVSMREWLREHARMTTQGAGDLLALGRFLAANTAFAEAALTGQLSAGQLSVARRLGRGKFAGLLAEQQHDLVAALTPLDIRSTIQAVDHWRKCAEAVIDEPAPPIEPPCEMTFARTLDDVVHGNFHLHDAAGTELEKAVQNAITWDGTDETRSLAERQGDALFDICAFFNKNHLGAGTPRHLPHVSLSADLSTVTSKVPEGVNDDTGRPMSPACTATYLCDCTLHVIVRDASGNPEQFGRAHYTAPRSLFRQIAARDGGCRFPGCNRPVRFTDAHHIHHWEHGGFTDFDNLLLLCSRHHHYVHRHRLTVKLLPNGHAHFTWDDGRHRESTPRGAPPSRPPD